MSVRALALSLVGCLIAHSAIAEEKIDRFDVAITVETDGDIEVTETIQVTSEGTRIRRGIFRDLPRYYADDAGRPGDKLPYQYDVKRVIRDGRREPFTVERDGNAFRIRIGDADVFLTHGSHTYEIEYEVKNQIRYFDDHDELYWNVTGNYWLFPIDQAAARITLPEDARVSGRDAYTGGFGDVGHDYSYRQSSGAHVFEATRPFQPGEGMTVTVSLGKGVIEPPSLSDKGALWWFRYGSLGLLLASFLGVLAFLMRSFRKVGEDPPKGPVFARYEPPRDLSPAAVHHIFFRGLRGHAALISTLISMGAKGLVDIDASEKKSTVLTRKPDAVAPLSADEKQLDDDLFDGAGSRTLGGKYDASFTTAYALFRKSLSRKYGKAYFRWNLGYTLGAVVLTIAGIALAVTQTINWSWWHMAIILALAATNALFMYLMPAPTPKGQQVRTEIEGFKLYLETAEKLQMNSVEVGSDAPPPMSTERYERFLPYAVALDVEKPWTKYFEKTLPAEAAAYSPAWGHFGSRSFGSVGGMNDAIMSSMNTGVSSSLPQSSSSSGGGGGGFSGGGGGGGGGGGW
jgi:uncharacterized membrane protein YgcG